MDGSQVHKYLPAYDIGTCPSTYVRDIEGQVPVVSVLGDVLIGVGCKGRQTRANTDDRVV